MWPASCLADSPPSTSHFTFSSELTDTLPPPGSHTHTHSTVWCIQIRILQETDAHPQCFSHMPTDWRTQMLPGIRKRLRHQLAADCCQVICIIHLPDPFTRRELQPANHTLTSPAYGWRVLKDLFWFTRPRCLIWKIKWGHQCNYYSNSSSWTFTPFSASTLSSDCSSVWCLQVNHLLNYIFNEMHHQFSKIKCQKKTKLSAPTHKLVIGGAYSW